MNNGLLENFPPVTKYFLGAIITTNLAVKLNYLNVLQLYFNPKLIIEKGQIYRIFTSFLFLVRESVNIDYINSLSKHSSHYHHRKTYFDQNLGTIDCSCLIFLGCRRSWSICILWLHLKAYV